MNRDKVAHLDEVERLARGPLSCWRWGERMTTLLDTRVSNAEVVSAWNRRETARSMNMMSDGAHLYSYALCIGEWRDGLPVVFNYTAHEDGNPFGHIVASEGFVSVTTSGHVGLARRVGYCFEK